jgi:hypothetical protein
VHGRDVKDGEDQFGVSGYVYKNTFLMFDRRTESLWYPMSKNEWTAISGTRKGETIPIVAEPEVMKLGEWRKKHPKTVVLLGSKGSVADREGE